MIEFLTPIGQKCQECVIMMSEGNVHQLVAQQ